MAALADAFVRVRADTSSVPKDVQAGFARSGADQAGESAGHKWSAGFGAALKRGAMAGALGATGLALFGLKAAAANEQAQISFETMLGSAEKAGSFLKDLGDFAAKTPFELPELKTAASSLISVGVESSKVIPIMTSLGNATSGMGTGAEGVQRATRALQQMSQSGRITAEDLNQLTDAGVPAMQLLASATGKPVAAIAKMKDEGKLGKKEMEALFKALETGKGLERFSGLMDKQSQSLTGMLSTIKDTFTQGLANAMMPALPTIKRFIGGANTALSGFFAGLSGKGATAGAGLASTFAGLGSKLATFAGRVKAALSGQGADGAKLKELFNSVKDSVSKLVPVVEQFIGQLPAIGEVAGVGAAALKLLADHAGLLKDALPLIIAGFVAYKVSQIAVNIAQAASIPLQAAQVTATFAQAAAMRGHTAALNANTVAMGGELTVARVSLLTRIRSTASMVAGKIATFAMSAATKAYAATQWLLNAALSANPIGLIVIGLAALAGAVYLAWTKSETFRKVVTAAFNGVKAAASAVFDWVKANWPLLLAIITGPIGIAVLTVVKHWDAIKGAFSKGVAAVIGWLKQQWPLLIAIITGPLGLVVLAIVKHWGAIKAAFSVGVEAVKRFLSGVVSFLSNTWSGAKELLMAPIRAALSFLKGLWDREVQGWKTILTGVKTFLSNTWAGAKDLLMAPIQAALSFLKGLWAREVQGWKTILTGVKTFLSNTWSGAKDLLIAPIKGAASKVAEVITGIKTQATTKLGELVTFFKGIPGKLASALGGLGSLLSGKVKDGLRPVLDFIQHFVVDNLNKIVSKFPGGFEIPPVNMAFAKGGVVPGYAPGRDTVHAMLSPGEGVLTPQTVRKIGGKAAIEQLNAFGGSGVGGIGSIGSAIGRGVKKGVVTTGRGIKAGASAVTPDFVGELAGRIEEDLRKGFAFASEHLMNPLVDRARSAFGGNIIGDIGVGALAKLRDLVVRMAKGKDEAAAAASGGAPQFIGGPLGQIVFPLPAGSYRVGGGLNSYAGHTGQDFPAPSGTPVYSPFQGNFVGRQLFRNGAYYSYGNMANVFGAQGLQFIGGHLSRFARGNGPVRAGELIGYVGDTGHSFGSHLHAEFRRNGSVIDPHSVLRYDTGGLLTPGGRGINTTRRPERVLSPQQTAAFERLVSVMEKGDRGGLVVQVDARGATRRDAFAIADVMENTVVMNGWAG